MRCVCLAGNGPESTLIEKEIAEPAPSPGEILVRVRAAGVTTTELTWDPTLHSKSGQKRFDAVPAHEFSGEIAALGAGVGEWAIGQEVYGMNDWYADGALAEFCITQPAWMAPKPARLSHVEAASVPIAALTAWQGLFDRAKLQAGEHVLVQGGAGGVGCFAVQLARIRGAHAWATVSAHNLEFVKGLGAEEAIDYKATRFEDVVRNMDVVFDTVGGDTLQRSWRVLKDERRMVTVVSDNEKATDEKIQRAFFIVEPNGRQLSQVGALLDSEQLYAIVDTVLPLSQAPLAYSGKLAKKGRGKLVIAVPE
jgi:NADPH:quinone reductase-like Zn-dependent oxidoreductase